MCSDSWSKLFILGGYNIEGYIASELIEVEILNVENKSQVDQMKESLIQKKIRNDLLGFGQLKVFRESIVNKMKSLIFDT